MLQADQENCIMLVIAIVRRKVRLKATCSSRYAWLLEALNVCFNVHMIIFK